VRRSGAKEGERRREEEGKRKKKRKKKRGGKKKREREREKEKGRERGRGIAPAPIATGGRAWPTGSRAARYETAVRKKRRVRAGKKMERRLKSDVRTAGILGGD